MEELQEPTPIHYDWLQQGRADAQLSPAQLIVLTPLDMATLQPAELLSELNEKGVVVLRNHGVQHEAMFGQARRFFALAQDKKMALAKRGQAAPPQPMKLAEKTMMVPRATIGATDKKKDKKTKPVAKVKPTPPSMSEAPPDAPEEVPIKSKAKPQIKEPMLSYFPQQPPQPHQPVLRSNRSPTSDPNFRPYVSKATIGFQPMRGEVLNRQMRPDAKETFDYLLETMPDGTTALSNLMPNLQDFDRDSRAYVQANCQVARTVLQALTEALGLPKNVFDEHFEKPLAIQRLIRYSPQNMGVRDEIGAAAHVDYGAVTVLKEDSPGLEVYIDGAWRLVICPSECVIVSTGFLLEKLTGGAIKATQHRVVNRNPAQRYSTALFFDPHPLSFIAPVLPVKGADLHKYEKCQALHKGVKYVHGAGGYNAKEQPEPLVSF